MGIWPGKMHGVVEGGGCESSARCSRGFSMARRSAAATVRLRLQKMFSVMVMLKVALLVLKGSML